MDTNTSYEILADVLARHIYTYWCLDEPRVVDDMCASQFQIPASVLSKLKILEYENVRHSVFVCEPGNFRKTALKNKAHGCGYDTLVLALVLTAEFGMGHDVDMGELIDCLVKLEICEPQERDAPFVGSQHKVIGYKDKEPHIGYVWKDKEPQIRYVWTEKKKFYDNLYSGDWPLLIK